MGRIRETMDSETPPSRPPQYAAEWEGQGFPVRD